MTLIDTAKQIVAKAKKGKGKGKLPVPPPKGTDLGTIGGAKLVLVDDSLDIPESLKVKNRKPLTQEQQRNVDAAVAKAYDPVKKNAELRDAQKAHRAAQAKEKRDAKLARAAAKKAVEEAKKQTADPNMPLTGKAAQRAIAAAVDEGIKNGDLKVTKIEKAAPAPRKAKGAEKTAPAPSTKARTAKPTGKPRKGKAGQTKSELIGNLLRRKNGATTADILQATGWVAVNVPREGAKSGLKIRKVKDDGVTRYYGSA